MLLRPTAIRFLGLLSAALFLAPGARAQSVITASPDPAHPILSAPFQAETDARSRSRLTSGNALDLLEDGVEAFPLKYAIVATATAEVMVSSMVWAYDATGRSFADALIARARAGVVVRCIVDGLWADPRIVWRLRRGGVRVARYNPWILGFGGPEDHRMHQKVVCADLARATVGGMNIGDAYALANGTNAYFHDVDLFAEGYAAVEVARRFLELYTRLEPRDAGAAALLATIDTRAQAPGAAGAGRDGFARSIFNEPDLGVHHITDYYVRAISAARRQVLIAVNHPMPVDPLLAAVKAAAARGVRVVILTNSKLGFTSRNGLAGFFENWWVRRLIKQRLGDPGIEIWELDTPLHAKTLSVDGVVASVGSYNFSNSSIRKHAEQVLVTYDAAIVRDVEESFERDMARARRTQ